MTVKDISISLKLKYFCIHVGGLGQLCKKQSENM